MCWWKGSLEKRKSLEQKLSHFLVSFWAAWWASRPSERLLSLLHSINSVFCRPPNHLTHTQSLEFGSPSGPLTIFPGHASQPRVAPQIKSPILKFVVVWLSALVVGGLGEFWDAGIESSDSITSAATGLIVFTGGDSFNKSKSLFSGTSSSFGVSSTGVSDRWSDDADSRNFRGFSCQFYSIKTAHDNDFFGFNGRCECNVHERKR